MSHKSSTKLPTVRPSNMSLSEQINDDSDNKDLDVFDELFKVKRQRLINIDETTISSKTKITKKKQIKKKNNLYSLDNLIRDREKEIEENERRQKLLDEAHDLSMSKEIHLDDTIKEFMNEHSFSEGDSVIDEFQYDGEILFNLNSYIKKYQSKIKLPLSLFRDEKDALFLINGGYLKYHDEKN